MLSQVSSFLGGDYEGCNMTPFSLIPNYQTTWHKLQHASSIYSIFSNLRVVNKQYNHTHKDVYVLVFICNILYFIKKNVLFSLCEASCCVLSKYCFANVLSHGWLKLNETRQRYTQISHILLCDSCHSLDITSCCGRGATCFIVPSARKVN